MANQVTPPPVKAAGAQRVVVTGVDIEFGDMCNLAAKASLAIAGGLVIIAACVGLVLFALSAIASLV